MRHAAAAIVLLTSLALVGCGAGEARAAYARAEAHLRAGELDAAEQELDRAERTGDATLSPYLRFLRGTLEFRRAEIYARAASEPGAERTLLDRAIVAVEDAQTHWRQAAMSRIDWPAARRNVERALLVLADLREQKSTGQRRPIFLPGGEGAEPAAGRDPPPPPPPSSPDQPPPPEGGVDAGEMLSPEDIGALLEALERKDSQKRALRLAAPARSRAPGGKDW